MHKGVILLTIAENKQDAKSNAESFLENHTDDVLDWYSIGGRWSNSLAPKDKIEEFTKQAHDLYPILKGSYAIKEIENDTVRPILQNLWESLGLKGKNIYYDSYAFKLEEEDKTYDIIPLIDCIDVVKEWVRDLKSYQKECWNEMISAHNNNNESSSAYYAGLYKDAVYNSFCFDSNVYNIDLYEGETIPDDIEKYYAVMIDMHS